MEITITTFVNPFSFFCKINDNNRNVTVPQNNVESLPVLSSKNKGLGVIDHGQYVAVFWKNEWVRGLISMESQFLIWLIDNGTYIRPDENFTYVNLPPEFKTLPTKIFEASIHGVVPIDKILNLNCEVESTVSTSWNSGVAQRALTLIASAQKTYFVPIALLSTKTNDIVLGDLYLDIKEKGIINIIDELEIWPAFLERNKKDYIENLYAFYTTRRRHHLCQLKPVIPDIELQIMSCKTTLAEYEAFCASATSPFECDAASADGSTIIDVTNRDVEVHSLAYELTPAEIEKYSNMFITVNGREYNVLHVLINKARDLKNCERYRDHDKKSVGRANTYSSMRKLFH